MGLSQNITLPWEKTHSKIITVDLPSILKGVEHTCSYTEDIFIHFKKAIHTFLNTVYNDCTTLDVDLKK